MGDQTLSWSPCSDRRRATAAPDELLAPLLVQDVLSIPRTVRREQLLWLGAQMQAGRWAETGASSEAGPRLFHRDAPCTDVLADHLSALETAFRTTGTYLLGQFFRQKRGKEPDFFLQGLVDIYGNIRTVNRAMANRISSAFPEDAGINALVILDFFAVGIPLTVEAEIKELESIFRSYFEREKSESLASDQG